MIELKPTKELIRIYGLQEESGQVCGLMIASQMPIDLIKYVLKQMLEMLEKGQGQHLKDVPIKDLGNIKLHTET